MLNHITLKVRDIERSKQFYAQALAPLGYAVLSEDEGIVGLGTQDVEGARQFWIHAADTVWLREASERTIHSFSCLAFTANNKETVERFYKAALAAGGIDNGAPGYRPQYHPGYYAAFVLDPDGYNIEAVWDDWETMQNSQPPEV